MLAQAKLFSSGGSILWKEKWAEQLREALALWEDSVLPGLSEHIRGLAAVVLAR